MSIAMKVAALVVVAALALVGAWSLLDAALRRQTPEAMSTIVLPQQPSEPAGDQEQRPRRRAAPRLEPKPRSDAAERRRDSKDQPEAPAARPHRVLPHPVEAPAPEPARQGTGDDDGATVDDSDDEGDDGGDDTGDEPEDDGGDSDDGRDDDD